MENNKFPKQYQYVYNQVKDDYKTEGYEIDWIDEIYLPFWICKQEVYVQTEVKPDELSRILFGLINNGIKNRKEICNFLGIKDDDFTLTQIDYLINNDFIEENFKDGNSIYYEITHAGRDFFEEKNNDNIQIETAEIDYIIPEIEHITEERYETFFNDLNQVFVNINESIDAESNENFSGYKVIQTHKLVKNNNGALPSNCIKHGDKPTLKKIKKSNFIEFFNNNHESYFYEFNENKSIEVHKRSIKFYLIHYAHKEDNSLSNKVEVRHCPESINKFDKTRPRLEEKLSQSMEKYLNQNYEFIEKLKQHRQEKSKPRN